MIKKLAKLREAKMKILVVEDEIDLNNVIVKHLKKNGYSVDSAFSSEQVDLTGKEYEILEFLMLNKGRILTREQIKERVWDFDYTGGSNVIDVLVKNIRKKLGECEVIQTKRGLGYVIKD